MSDDLKEFDICEWVLDTVSREVVGRDHLIDDIECSWPTLAEKIKCYIETYNIKPPPSRNLQIRPEDMEPKKPRCFHCNRELTDQGEDDPNVDRLALTMRIQKWSIDVSAITYLCACGANTTRLGNVTAAYHDTWDREFGD